MNSIWLLERTRWGTVVGQRRAEAYPALRVQNDAEEFKLRGAIQYRLAPAPSDAAIQVERDIACPPND